MTKDLTEPHLRCLFTDAYEWLCRSRKKHPPSSDVWYFRRCWRNRTRDLMDAFYCGEYCFDVQSKISLAEGDRIAVWSSRDALVLKVLTWVIQERVMPFFLKTCYHLKGHGRLKGGVRDVMKHYTKCRFFCKTDVKQYYDSVDHYILLIRLHDYIQDRRIVSYVWQFLNRCVEWDGLYQDISRGISRGSSLSPLLGALYLLDLDRRMDKMDVKYFRYMDDILILAPTRWKLKKAIRVLNQTFNELKFEKHPHKTLIGRTEQGFDFLGYHFGPGGLFIAKKTVENFFARAIRLYEQGSGEPSDSARLGVYVQRWVTWVGAGLPKGTMEQDAHVPYTQKSLCLFIQPQF